MWVDVMQFFAGVGKVSTGLILAVLLTTLLVWAHEYDRRSRW